MAEKVAQSSRPRLFRFSLGNLLLLVLVVCLATALLVTHRRLVQLERSFTETQRELRALQPLSAEDVAIQFEKSTTGGPIATTVEDVRYSPTEDAYKVSFSWLNATTGQSTYTSVKLKGDGFGAYKGVIHSAKFATPLGHKDSVPVFVRTASPLTK